MPIGYIDDGALVWVTKVYFDSFSASSSQSLTKLFILEHSTFWGTLECDPCASQAQL